MRFPSSAFHRGGSFSRGQLQGRPHMGQENVAASKLDPKKIKFVQEDVAPF